MSVDDGLRQLFRAHLPRTFIQAIETGQTGRGIPDLYYIHQGHSGWVECKATSAWSVPLEAEQVAWLCRHARAGGRSFVAVRRRHAGGPRKGPPEDQLYLYRGADSPRLRAEGLLGPDHVLRFDGGPRSWNWPAILALLTAPPPQ